MNDIGEDLLSEHPAFVGFRQVIPLAGFSGARVALVRAATGAQFVRKAALLATESNALRAQAARQQWLRGRLAGAAEVPEVLREETIGDLYYFDMEFVPSRDARAFLSNAPFEDVERFAGRIELLMRHLADLSVPETGPLDAGMLSSKLLEIDQKTAGRHGRVLEPLHASLAKLKGFPSGMQATVAHGDLTLENVLVGPRDRIWLIDPIKSPVDHYWFDWAKLFQDCEGRWYAHRGKQLSTGVTHWLRNRWLKSARTIAPDYADWHHLLLALTFARILPYARTKADVEFVTERVATFGQSAWQRTHG